MGIIGIVIGNWDGTDGTTAFTGVRMKWIGNIGRTDWVT